jgi:hypothetical protein
MPERMWQFVPFEGVDSIWKARGCIVTTATCREQLVLSGLEHVRSRMSL